MENKYLAKSMGTKLNRGNNVYGTKKNASVQHIERMARDFWNSGNTDLKAYLKYYFGEVDRDIISAVRQKVKELDESAG